MKALVLAGGCGTRLRPFTPMLAKQLIPLGNQPVILHVLRSIAAAGVRSTGIVVAETGGEIKEVVGSHSCFGMEVGYIRQQAPLGLADAVRAAQDYLSGDDFVLHLGDNLLLEGLGRLIHDFRTGRPAAQIMLRQVGDPRAFGVAEIAPDGRVAGLEEKPSQPRSHLALVGAYVFTPSVHEAIREIKPSSRGELEITDAIARLIDSGHPVRYTLSTGYWRDIGTVADVLDANRAVLDGLTPRVSGMVDARTTLHGAVVVEASAQVRASLVIGPAIIGAGAVVAGSTIGPHTSIAASCRVLDSKISHSILLRGASLRGVGPIEASLIGRYTDLSPARTATKAHRFILGDHCVARVPS